MKTVSQAMNMPDAAITLSTPRSIMPTRMTTPSPTAMTIRKLELVSNASRLLTVRKDGARAVATAQMTMRKATGRRTLPGGPASAPAYLRQGTDVHPVVRECRAGQPGGVFEACG